MTLPSYNPLCLSVALNGSYVPFETPKALPPAPFCTSSSSPLISYASSTHFVVKSATFICARGLCPCSGLRLGGSKQIFVCQLHLVIHGNVSGRLFLTISPTTVTPAPAPWSHLFLSIISCFFSSLCLSNTWESLATSGF